MKISPMCAIIVGKLDILIACHHDRMSSSNAGEARVQPDNFATLEEMAIQEQ